MKKAFILDISAFLHRGYFAFPDLKASDGTPSGALYFFMTKLIDIFQNFGKPDYLIAAIDSKAQKLFRNELYPEYKSGRKSKPEELKIQFEIFKEIANNLGMQMIEKPGYEADDIIGYCTKYFSTINVESYMFTTDKDMAQLCVNDLVKQVIMLTAEKSKGKGLAKYKIIDKKSVVDFLGVEANQIPDLFGLIGDKADAIPGVKMIGEKKGATLINTYGFLENIYSNIDSITGKTKEYLLQDKENAFLSRKLATIETDFKIEEAIQKWLGFEFSNLKTLLEKLDMYKTMTLLDLTFENLKDNHTNSIYDLIYVNRKTEETFKTTFIFNNEWDITTFKIPKHFITEQQYIDFMEQKENALFNLKAPNLITGINLILKEFGINLKIHKMPFIYCKLQTIEMLNEIEKEQTELILNKR